MTLEDKLIAKLFERYGRKGQNVQTVLDNSYFQGMSLADKVRLIEKHRGDLSKDPKFNWTAVGTGLTAGAISATSAVFMKQLMTNIPNVAGHKFNPNYVALGLAGVLGAGVGAAMQRNVSKKEYDRDMATKNNVHDPLKVLIERSMSAPPARPNVLLPLLTRLQNAPIEVGEAASRVTFSMPPKN